MNNNNLENTLKDTTATKPSAEPSYCVSCNQFFGNPAFDNMCSKCYKDRTKNASAKPKAAESSSTQATSQQSSATENTNTAEESKENDLPQQTDKSKCWNCSRKVGVMGYACRCGYTFCKSHRLPEDHTCAYDYSTKGKEILKEKNPLVAASKLEKF